VVKVQRPGIEDVVHRGVAERRGDAARLGLARE